MQHITYAEFLGRFKIRQKIGQGGYGEVFRAYDSETKQYRAFKKIVLRPKEDPYSFLNEIDLQGSLAHPLVLKIFEFYLYQAHDKHLGKKVEIGIISELGKASLHRLIRDKNNQFPIEQIINFAFHFTKLFAYFQDLNIVHRDIKPQNFVQVGSGLQCKLIDFGLCTHVKDIRHTAGSFAYMSPILKKMHSQKQLRGLIKSNPYKNDVYSFGLTLYELITKQGPTGRDFESAQKYSSNVLYKTQNQKLAQIVQMMLEYEEEIRPDFNQLFNIFKQNFLFIEEDPVNQIDGYSDKDLAKMNCHERHAVIKKRIEFQQKMQKTEKKKHEQFDFRRTNKFHESQQQDESNIQKFESKQVCYVDKELEEEVSRRKKRHFGNQKVILKEESTGLTYKDESYFKDKSPQYQKTEQRYNRRHNEHEREYESPQNRNENDKTVEIDKTVICQPFQTRNEQNFNQISQKTVEIPVGQHTQVQQTQPQIQPQSQAQPKKFHWKMPEGISVTALVMMKGHIICGCSDGSVRVINPISKNKDISYKIIGGKDTHEGSKITVMTKDAHGMVWTASEDGKIIMWIRTHLFTELENDKNYTQQTLEKVNENGEKQIVKDGWVKLSSQVNKLVKLETPRPGITSLFCYNRDRFGIGYKDGTVFIQWDFSRFTHKKHTKPITSIRRQYDQIFTSSLDGTIAILDMKHQKLRDQTFKCPFGIKNFMVVGDSPQPGFFIVAVDGRGYMHETSNGIWELTDNVSFRPLDVRDSFFSNSESAFMLISNGHILKNGQYQVDCGGADDWNCMFWDEKSTIAIGSGQGWVCLICYE